MILFQIFGVCLFCLFVYLFLVYVFLFVFCLGFLPSLFYGGLRLQINDLMDFDNLNTSVWI